MNHVPQWWEATLLTLASFRVTRLVGWDTITERWRQRTVKRHPRGWIPKLLTCPWCLGWWISLAWWAAWLELPHATMIAATPWALSGAVGLIARNLDP